MTDGRFLYNTLLNTARNRYDMPTLWLYITISLKAVGTVEHFPSRSLQMTILQMFGQSLTGPNLQHHFPTSVT